MGILLYVKNKIANGEALYIIKLEVYRVIPCNC